MPFSKKLFSEFVVPKEKKDIRDLISPNDKPKYEDDELECMQFGICSFNRPQRVIL